MQQIRKIEGLSFLQKYFGDLCVDCLFIHHPNDLEHADLDPIPGRVWRIRSGRQHGSEVMLPHRTCYSVEQVNHFIYATYKADSQLEFVVHRVTSAWPQYVGTLALLNNPHPRMTIDIQEVLSELIDAIYTGKRPRDWPVTLRISYDFCSIVPESTQPIAETFLRFLAHPLYRLHQLGRDIDDLVQLHYGRSVETFTRFNIYKSGELLLDDLRSFATY